jgi:hypothetical protein
MLEKPKSASPRGVTTIPSTQLVESSFDIERNPNGIASQSPRLPYSATLGHQIAVGPNPNGVVAFAPRMMNNQPWRRRATATVRPQPLQGCRTSSGTSARYRHPG